MKEKNRVIAGHCPSHRNKVFDCSPKVLEPRDLEIPRFNHLRDLRTHLEQCSLLISGITDREMRIRPMCLDRMANWQRTRRFAEAPIAQRNENFSRFFHQYLFLGDFNILWIPPPNAALG